MKTYWLTPDGASWMDPPTAAGRYELSSELHDIFDGSDKHGISDLDLYTHGFSWSVMQRLMRYGLVTNKLSESVWSKDSD